MTHAVQAPGLEGNWNMLGNKNQGTPRRLIHNMRQDSLLTYLSALQTVRAGIQTNSQRHSQRQDARKLLRGAVAEHQLSQRLKTSAIFRFCVAGGSGDIFCNAGDAKAGRSAIATPETLHSGRAVKWKNFATAINEAILLERSLASSQLQASIENPAGAIHARVFRILLETLAQSLSSTKRIHTRQSQCPSKLTDPHGTAVRTITQTRNLKSITLPVIPCP